MDKNYEKSIHRVGRIGVIIGIGFMLGIPAAICQYYHVWPKGIGEVLMVASGLLAVFVPTNIAEVLGYTPMLGSSAYITFLTGNVMNLKIPVVINAQSITETSQGTDEGDTVAAIGVAASSIVTTLIIALGVLLLVPLRPVLTSPVVQTATQYMLPALFGGLLLSFVNDDCGEYIAKNKSLSMILPMALVFIINAFIPLAGKEGFAVLLCMAVTAAGAFVLYKKGIITMTHKSGLK